MSMCVSYAHTGCCDLVKDWVAHIESRISIPDPWEALLHEVTWGAWLLPSCGSTIFNEWLPHWQGEVTAVLFITQGVVCMADVNVSDLGRPTSLLPIFH